MAILLRLPWWLCLLIGVVAYVVLHGIASQPYPTTLKVNEVPGAMFGSIFRALAMAGQYLLPILCLGAALASFFTRRRRRELLLHTTEGGASAAAIDAMSWQDFERLVGEAFNLQGFTVTEKGGAGADGGVDLELVKNGERYLVQAKHWRAKQVPVEVVRELAGVMPFRRAVGAYVVTSGRFTAPAADFAKGRGIVLVNGTKLDVMLKQARASLDAKRGARTRAGVPPASRAASTSAPVDLEAPPIPHCPSCGTPMKLRTAGKGANAGLEFWGCSNFPRCKRTWAA